MNKKSDGFTYVDNLLLQKSLWKSQLPPEDKNVRYHKE